MNLQSKIKNDIKLEKYQQKENEYKNNLLDLRKNKLAPDIDLRKKLTPQQKSLITRRSNNYENIIARDYSSRKITKTKTLNILKKTNELIIGDRIYFPTNSNVSFALKNGEVKVNRQYSKNRKTTKKYHKTTGNYLLDLFNKIRNTKLKKGQFFVMEIDGVESERIFIVGEDLIQYIKEMIDSGLVGGKTFGFGVINFKP